MQLESARTTSKSEPRDSNKVHVEIIVFRVHDDPLVLLDSSYLPLASTFSDDTSHCTASNTTHVTERIRTSSECFLLLNFYVTPVGQRPKRFVNTISSAQVERRGSRSGFVTCRSLSHCLEILNSVMKLQWFETQSILMNSCGQ